MSCISKNDYPKAIPCRSPEELAVQNNRLNQSNEELAEKARRLSQRNEELAEKAVRLRRWTFRATCACLGLVLLAGGALAFVIQFPGVLIPAAPAQPNANAIQEGPAKETKIAPPAGLVKVNPPSESAQASKAPVALPATALAKPDAGPANPAQKAGFLEALGGLSATHLYQTHLNIGLLADGVESETYTVEEAEKNLKSVVDLMKLVDVQLTKVTKSGIDKEDQESIVQIQTVASLLRLQVDSLRAYWATGEMEHAAQYHKARKASWQGLSKVMGIDS